MTDRLKEAVTVLFLKNPALHWQVGFFFGLLGVRKLPAATWAGSVFPESF
jgi:hypothetical protein